MRLLIGQDGEQISAEVLKSNLLETKDTRYIKQEDKVVYDFVGFIIGKEEMIAVFPKHYFETTDCMASNKEDVKLLFTVINRYVMYTRSKARADKYIGSLKEYESDYPFSAFFRIYEYYKKYGVYFKEANNYKKGFLGKIDWKKTISNSNTIISNGNLIYYPLYSKNKEHSSNFISDCMVFAINHTLELFPLFISSSHITNWKQSTFDYLENTDYVISMLRIYRREEFKDINRNLIDDLIEFFNSFDKKRYGGKFHFKINYFDLIWQDMVSKYLNDRFVYINSSNEMVFDENKRNHLVFDVATYNIDESSHHYKIILDHYAKSNDSQYIFDSKYYYDIEELNYKQFVYDIVLDYINNQTSNLKTYSALLLPGFMNDKIHLNVKKEYNSLISGNHYIIEKYLAVKDVMQNYIK